MHRNEYLNFLVDHFGMPIHFVASPELDGRFRCRPESHRYRMRTQLVLQCVLFSTSLAMFCTSATCTATAFPNHSPHSHFLCTSSISSLAFLPHLPLTPQIPICFPDCIEPVLVHVLPSHGRGVSVPLLRFAFWRYRWNRLILYFPKSPEKLPSDTFSYLLHASCAPSENLYDALKARTYVYRQQTQHSTHIVIA
jgi:hypothetical protein